MITGIAYRGSGQSCYRWAHGYRVLGPVHPVDPRIHPPNIWEIQLKISKRKSALHLQLSPNIIYIRKCTQTSCWTHTHLLYLSMIKVWLTDFTVWKELGNEIFFYVYCLLISSSQDLSLNILTIFKFILQFLEIFDFENWKIHLSESSNSDSTFKNDLGSHQTGTARYKDTNCISYTLCTIREAIKQELSHKDTNSISSAQ